MSDLPKQFGTYQLLKLLAKGGMGEIYLARTAGISHFEKYYAVKRLLKKFANDADVAARFIDEAKLGARLQHPNIVQVYDLGSVQEELFMATEFVDGFDLRRVLRFCHEKRKRIPLDIALFIVREMLSGLAYAHRQVDAEGQSISLVHRDISPQNVLVSFEGEVKIIDFGLAKSTQRSQETQANVLLGNFGYMSPEQARGQKLDVRTDVYSTGIVLFELVTGTKRFVDDNPMRLLEMVARPTPVLPSDRAPDVPRGIDRLYVGATAPDRDNRYRDAEAFRDEVTHALHRLNPRATREHLAQFLNHLFLGGQAPPSVDPDTLNMSIVVQVTDLHRSAEAFSRTKEDDVKDRRLTEFADSAPQTGSHELMRTAREGDGLSHQELTGEDKPPSALPPSGLPPSALPPSALPPSALPPSGLPPSGLPPSALPPSALPPSALATPEPSSLLASWGPADAPAAADSPPAPLSSSSTAVSPLVPMANVPPPTPWPPSSTPVPTSPPGLGASPPPPPSTVSLLPSTEGAAAPLEGLPQPALSPSFPIPKDTDPAIWAPRVTAPSHESSREPAPPELLSPHEAPTGLGPPPAAGSSLPVENITEPEALDDLELIPLEADEFATLPALPDLPDLPRLSGAPTPSPRPMAGGAPVPFSAAGGQPSSGAVATLPSMPLATSFSGPETVSSPPNEVTSGVQVKPSNLRPGAVISTLRPSRPDSPRGDGPSVLVDLPDSSPISSQELFSQESLIIDFESDSVPRQPPAPGPVSNSPAPAPSEPRASSGHRGPGGDGSGG